MSYTPQHSQSSPLLSGMIVRFPVDVDEYRSDFRDYRIGRIERIEETTSTAAIRALFHDWNEQGGSLTAVDHTFERSLELLARCRVLADTPFTFVSDARVHGQVLASCQEDFRAGKHLDYYVQVGGEIRRVSEAELWVGSTRQDPSPVAQALDYELQSPSWRQPRDQVVQGYGELRSATSASRISSAHGSSCSRTRQR